MSRPHTGPRPRGCGGTFTLSTWPAARLSGRSVSIVNLETEKKPAGGGGGRREATCLSQRRRPTLPPPRAVLGVGDAPPLQGPAGAPAHHTATPFSSSSMHRLGQVSPRTPEREGRRRGRAEEESSETLLTETCPSPKRPPPAVSLRVPEVGQSFCNPSGRDSRELNPASKLP